MNRNNDRLKTDARRRALALRSETLDRAWAWLAKPFARSGRDGAGAVTHPEIARQFR